MPRKPRDTPTGPGIQRASKNASRTLDIAIPGEMIENAENKRRRWAADLPAFCAECLVVLDRDAVGDESRKVPLKFTPSQIYIHDILTRMEQLNLKRSQQLHDLDPRVPVSRFPIRVRALKARKVKWSTYFQARIFHACEFRPGTTALTMAHERDAARNLAQFSDRFSLNWTKDLYRVDIPRINDDLIEWDPRHDSRIIVKTAGSKSGGSSASFTYNIDHFSEDALYEDDSEEQVSALAATPRNSEIYFESTARGDNHFKHAWDRAMWIEDLEKCFERGEPFPESWNGEVRAFWAWWQDEGYRVPLSAREKEQIQKTLTKDEKDGIERYGWDEEQIKWRREKLQGEATKQTELKPIIYFKREYPASPEEAFTASTSAVFDPESMALMTRVSDHVYRAMELGSKIDSMPFFVGSIVRDDFLPEKYRLDPIAGPGEPITDRMLDSCNFIIWSPPDPEASYIAGTDTAEGLDTGDDSVTTIYDRTDGMVLVEAARFIGKFPGEELAEITFYLCHLFNEAFWIGERGPHGRVTCVKMVELGYTNMYHAKNPELFADKDNPASFTSGWTPGNSNKAMIKDAALEALRNGAMILYHRKAIEQMRIFENKNGKLKAPPGKNDDCTITDMLCAYANKPGVAPPVWALKDPHAAPWDDSKLSGEEKQNKYWKEQLGKLREVEKLRLENLSHFYSEKAANARIVTSAEILDG